jgi:hypothetical protein
VVEVEVQVHVHVHVHVQVEDMSAKWAGWGAGPAGAGASGPSRAFLVAALIGSMAVAAFLARDGRLAAAGIAAACAIYFALRAFTGLGRTR